MSQQLLIFSCFLCLQVDSFRLTLFQQVCRVHDTSRQVIKNSAASTLISFFACFLCVFESRLRICSAATSPRRSSSWMPCSRSASLYFKGTVHPGKICKYSCYLLTHMLMEGQGRFSSSAETIQELHSKPSSQCSL